MLAHNSRADRTSDIAENVALLPENRLESPSSTSQPGGNPSAGESSHTMSAAERTTTFTTDADVEDPRQRLLKEEQMDQVLASGSPRLDRASSPRDSDQAGEGESSSMGECRICHEEDVIKNLDAPCACSGSLKYAHEACVQHWCNEKGNSMCEICHQPYKPTYVPAVRQPQQEPPSSVLSIEIREQSMPDGTSSRVLTLRDAVTGEETRFDLSEPEEPQDGLACCKLALLLVFVLLLLPRAFMLLVDADVDAEGDGGAADMLRVFGLVLPLLLLLRIIHLVNERRRFLEDSNSEAAEAAAQVAFLLHSTHAQLTARTGDGVPGSDRTTAAQSSLARPIASGVV